MNIQNLITMANQIGDFFSAYPDVEQAQKEIAEHLKKFWAKQMREQLQAYIDSNPNTGLHPVVEAAIKKHPQLFIWVTAFVTN